MKAIVKRKAAPGVCLEEMPIPLISSEEVLVEVKAAGICGSDIHICEWTGGYEWMEPLMPLIIGHEFSGVVVKKGIAVSSLKVGDRVACRHFLPCGNCLYCKTGRVHLCTNAGKKVMGLHVNGGFSEYVSIPEQHCIVLPDNLTFEDAALVEPLVVAGNAVYDGNILLGDTVVILGPGTIGLLTMVLAKANGAGKVIMVGTSKDDLRLACAREIGADHIIIADQENVLEKVLDITNGYGANVVFEATGVPQIIQSGLGMLQRGSRMVTIGIHSSPSSIEVTSIVRNAKQIVGSYGGPVTWERVISWMEAKSEYAVNANKVISDRFSFAQAEQAFEKCINKEAIKAMFIK